MSYASLEEAMVFGYGIERSFYCHVHDNRLTASASVNSVTGLWFCYSCGAKGKFNVADIPPNKAATSMIKYIDMMTEVRRVYTDSWLDVFDSNGPGEYWLSRFTPEMCKAYRLGQDPAGRFATIPVRNRSNEVLGVTRRDLTGQDPAKYRYPPGVTMSELLFNYYVCDGDYLMLTEGATDAIAAREAGWWNVVATYRNGISRAQRQLLAEYNPIAVLVAYDQDEAGQRGFEQIRHSLRSICRVDRVHWSDYKDLAAIPLADRTAMMDELAVRYP